MQTIRYTDEQRTAFLELAAEVGITRAKRDLKYPHSWITGKKWMDAAGIEAPLDEIKAQAAAHNDWYKTEDLMLVCQTGLNRAQDALNNTDELDADAQKKLAEAVQKYTNTMLTLMGKASSITERRTDALTPELMALYDSEWERNLNIEKKEDKSYQDLEVSH